MNRSRHVATRILLCLAVLSLLWTVASAARVKGKVKKGVYNSPARNFTVPVPQGLGMRVSDGFDRDELGYTGAVSFHDDFGSLRAIHYMSLPPDAVAALARPDALEPGLKSWLETVAMPHWFVSAAPGSHLTHEGFGTFEGLGAFFAVVVIPGGSPLVAMDPAGKSKRLDSTRGLVIFPRGRDLYMLATELKGLADHFGPNKGKESQPTAGMEAEWLHYVEGMKPFYRSITFLE